jgi:hypothetical protein
MYSIGFVLASLILGFLHSRAFDLTNPASRGPDGYDSKTSRGTHIKRFCERTIRKQRVHFGRITLSFG